MNKKQRTIKMITVSVNLVLAVFEVIGLVLMAKLYMDYGLPLFGWLWYYTQLSNIFSMVAAVLTAVYAILELKRKCPFTPRFVRLLKYYSACCLVQTFLVTAFVLAPMGMMGGFFGIMFKGPNLYHHFLCPIISVVSLCLLEKGERLKMSHCLYALVPTLIYGLVAVVLNLTKVWHGPYPFLYVYEQPVYMSVIWAITIPATAFGVNICLKLLLNYKSKS